MSRDRFCKEFGTSPWDIHLDAYAELVVYAKPGSPSCAQWSAKAEREDGQGYNAEDA